MEVRPSDRPRRRQRGAFAIEVDRAITKHLVGDEVRPHPHVPRGWGRHLP